MQHAFAGARPCHLRHRLPSLPCPPIADGVARLADANPLRELQAKRARIDARFPCFRITDGVAQHDDGRTLLELEDLARAYHRPCIMDIKVRAHSLCSLVVARQHLHANQQTRAPRALCVSPWIPLAALLACTVVCRPSGLWPATPLVSYLPAPSLWPAAPANAGGLPHLVPSG